MSDLAKEVGEMDAVYHLDVVVEEGEELLVYLMAGLDQAKDTTWNHLKA